MEKHNILIEIRSRVATGNLKGAIDFGIRYLRKDDFTLLASRYNRIRIQYTSKGTLTSEEYQVELNKITEGVLHAIETYPEQHHKKKSRTWVIIWLLINGLFLDWKRVATLLIIVGSLTGLSVWAYQESDQKTETLSEATLTFSYPCNAFDLSRLNTREVFTGVLKINVCEVLGKNHLSEITSEFPIKDIRLINYPNNKFKNLQVTIKIDESLFDKLSLPIDIPEQIRVNFSFLFMVSEPGKRDSMFVSQWIGRDEHLFEYLTLPDKTIHVYYQPNNLARVDIDPTISDVICNFFEKINSFLEKR